MTADGLYRALSARLGDRQLPLYVFESLDSTNTECARRLKQGERRALVLAVTQTAGRGRQGRRFFSPPGAGLYLSLLQPLPGGMSGAAGLTEYAAVCVARVVKQLTGLECGIKWVNDVFCGGRKVCGILCEILPGPGGGLGLIVGIGVNISDSAVPPELRQIVGSLEQPPELAVPLAAELVEALLKFDPDDRSFMQEYRARSILTGRRVGYLVNGQPREGIAEDIDDEGRLIVRLDCGGCDALLSGEVSLQKIEGLR